MKLKLKFKRIISFVMVLCMVASMFTNMGNVFAAGTDGFEDASSRLNVGSASNGSIYMLDGSLFNPSETNLMNPENEFQVRLSFDFDLDDRDILKWFYEIPDELTVSDYKSVTNLEPLYEGTKKVGGYYVADNIVYIIWDASDDERNATITLSAKWLEDTYKMPSVAVDWNKNGAVDRGYIEKTVYFDYADFTLTKDNVKSTVAGYEDAPLWPVASKGDNALYKEYVVTLNLKDKEDYLGSYIYGLSLKDSVGSKLFEAAQGMYSYNGDEWDAKIVYTGKDSGTETTYVDFTFGTADANEVRHQTFYIDFPDQFPKSDTNADGVSCIPTGNLSSIKIYYYVKVSEDNRPFLDGYADGAITNYYTFSNSVEAFYSVVNSSDAPVYRTKAKVDDIYRADGTWIEKSLEHDTSNSELD